MKDQCIICDLDGTLCLFGDKNPYDRDFENDVENEAVYDLLQRIDACNFEGVGYWTDIVFLSGRMKKPGVEEKTRKWLDDHGFKIYPLFMRENDDYRKDVEVKEELYNNHIKDVFKKVQFVLDDRDQVVQLWRKLGLTCFQVADGDF